VNLVDASIFIITKDKGILKYNDYRNDCFIAIIDRPPAGERRISLIVAVYANESEAICSTTINGH
jgi:hypothetical protein